MQSRVDFFGQFPTDAGNRCQLVDPGIGDPLQSAEMGNQRLATLGADAIDIVQP